MDVTDIARAASTIAETGIKQEAGIAVLKRAQDIEKATMTQLLDAIPATPKLPAHLGKNVNTTA
jgi:Putative motility protein